MHLNCVFLLLLLTIYIRRTVSSFDRDPFVVSIRFERPRVEEKSPGKYAGFVQTAADYSRLATLVRLNACDSRVKSARLANMSYVWSFVRIDNETVFEMRKTPNCSIEWHAPAEGMSYKVHVLALAGSQTVLTGTRAFSVRNIWLVAMGDSFASGQGNPDQDVRVMSLGGVPPYQQSSTPALWIDSTCFRSGKGSWPYQLYELLEEEFRDFGILFTFVACSGASIRYGLIQSPGEFAQSQIAQVEAIAKWANRRPDALLLSIGGNDVDISGLISGVFGGKPEAAFERLTDLFKMLQRDLTALHLNFKHRLGVDGNAIFYTEYFDFLRNENGVIDGSCPGLYLSTTEAFIRADQEFLSPLNAMIASTKPQFGWTVIEGITDLFREHGICSKKPFVRSVQESLEKQANCYGAFHPVAVANRKVAKRVWSYVRAHLLQTILS